jgi:hypothetical protein
LHITVQTLLSLTLLAICFNNLLAEHPHASRSPGILEAVLLWNNKASSVDSIDQESFASVVASTGLQVSKFRVEDVESRRIELDALLLVPHAASRSLSQRQVHLIVALVKKGMRIVADGPSPLLSALHFTLGDPSPVNVVVDRLMPDNRLCWADRPIVSWLSASEHGSFEVLYADSATGHPLVATGSIGKGKYIVLGPYFDEISGKGYSRFPTIVNAIARKLDVKPLFRRRGVDAYFDPGYRYNMKPESLATLWKTWGIRAVHAAAWYYNSAQVYDYGSLIEAAHRNGLLVYAWLEWPHVGVGFWNLHPEWRQKNALLQDAKLDFLHLMDLQNPDCMKTALDDLSRLLELDWDGVDIAEFTITGAGGGALEGPARPECFTSFGAPMRREFRELAGFDPLELVNPSSGHFWQKDTAGLNTFYEYRKTVNSRLLRHVVESLHALMTKGDRDWEFIHTIVDNSLHPEFNQLLGFDLNKTLSLVKEYRITLNVEDPYMEWTDPPDRYRRLRRTLMTLVHGRSSMIDINVVPIHPVTQQGFASSQPTGTELLQQLQYASENGGRVCVYAESSVFEQDWRLIPYAMANGVAATRRHDGFDVNAQNTVTLELPASGTVFNNGKRWPCHGTDGIVLPPGSHHVTFRHGSGGNSPASRDLRVEAISSELRDCKVKSTGFEITYSSPSRCLISLSALPKRIAVDGVARSLHVLRLRDSFIIVAPSGTHRITAS